MEQTGTCKNLWQETGVLQQSETEFFLHRTTAAIHFVFHQHQLTFVLP